MDVLVVPPEAEEALKSFQAGEYQRCLDQLHEIIALHPSTDNAYIKNIRGVCHMRLGQTDEALAQFTEVLSIHPDHPEATANRAATLRVKVRLQLDQGDKLFQSGDKAGALAVYQSLDVTSADEQTQFQIHNNRGAAMLQLGDLNGAWRAFDDALGLQPNNLEALFNKGAALESMGQHEEALQAFETAVSIDPQFHPAHSAKTTVLIALNRFDQAVAASTSAIELNGSDSKAFADRAFCHLKLKQYADAIQDFNTAKSLGDSTSETVRLYSMALRFHAEELNKSGNATAAVDLYDAALAESSDGQTNEDILFNKCILLIQLKRTSEAIEELNHLTSINNNNHRAQAALGALLLETGKPEDALPHLTIAAENQPSDPNILYSLGLASLKCQKLELAADSFRKLLVITPEDENVKKALTAVEGQLSYQAALRAAESKPAEPLRPAPSSTASTAPTAPTAPTASTPTPTIPTPIVEEKQPEPVIEAKIPEPTPEYPPHRDSGTFFFSATPSVDEMQRDVQENKGQVFVKMVFPYEQLKFPGPFPDGINCSKREEYLSDEEFQTLFQMNRDSFSTLPAWKKQAKKKELGLF